MRISRSPEDRCVRISLSPGRQCAIPRTHLSDFNLNTACSTAANCAVCCFSLRLDLCRFMPISTRSKNSDTHPGLVDLPAHRRSSKEVEAERLAKADKKAAKAKTEQDIFQRIAEVEDSMASKDRKTQAKRAKGRQPPGKAKGAPCFNPISRQSIIY